MMTMTIHLLTILSILITPSSAFGPTIRHTGRSHPHPKVLVRRQTEGNSPGAGLNAVVPPPPIVPVPVPSSTHVTFPEIILATYTYPMPTVIEDPPTATSIPTLSHYVFPTTVVHIAVATVCPDMPSSSAIFPLVSTDLSSSEAPKTIASSSLALTSHVPVYVDATVFLPSGSSTVFLSLSTSTVTISPVLPSLESTPPPSAETARIVQDSNGCQTVYTAATIPCCSTMIRPPGMLPVPVTDCEQWVTFSSQKLGDCSSAEYTILPATIFPAGESPTPPTPTFGPVALPPSPSPTPPSPQITGPVAFYAAHWYELAQHPVPNIVRVENCLPDTTSGSICQTSSEAWSVVHSTSVITTSSVASFSGVCSVPPFPIPHTPLHFEDIVPKQID